MTEVGRCRSFKLTSAPIQVLKSRLLTRLKPVLGRKVNRVIGERYHTIQSKELLSIHLILNFIYARGKNWPEILGWDRGRAKKEGGLSQ